MVSVSSDCLPVETNSKQALHLRPVARGQKRTSLPKGLPPDTPTAMQLSQGHMLYAMHRRLSGGSLDSFESIDDGSPTSTMACLPIDFSQPQKILPNASDSYAAKMQRAKAWHVQLNELERNRNDSAEAVFTPSPTASYASADSLFGALEEPKRAVRFARRPCEATAKCRDTAVTSSQGNMPDVQGCKEDSLAAPKEEGSVASGLGLKGHAGTPARRRWWRCRRLASAPSACKPVDGSSALSGAKEDADAPALDNEKAEDARLGV